MDTPNARFSLRALLVVVTVAAIIAWYFRPDKIEIIGDISRADISAIRKIVSERPGPQTQLIWMEKVTPNQVKTAGRWDFGGRLWVLEKTNDQWFVIFETITK